MSKIYDNLYKTIDSESATKAYVDEQISAIKGHVEDSNDFTNNRIDRVEDVLVKLRDENIALHNLTEKVFRDFIILIILIIIVVLTLFCFYIKLINTNEDIVNGVLKIKEDYKEIDNKINNIENNMQID